ncbi:MAG: SPOR domain-containing protein, partial [Smithellaceae bacterium]|nr:SPOR domain-containing protein [Smithellaceae bacterium]
LGISELVRNSLDLSPVQKAKSIQAEEEKQETVASAPADGNFDLTFYNTLNKKGTAGKDIVSLPEGKGPVAGAVPIAPDPSQVTVVGGEAAKAASVPKRSQVKKQVVSMPLSVPVAKSRSASAPTAKGKESVKTTSGAQKFLVHVVSVKDKVKAEQLAKKLKVLGYRPKVVPVALPKQGKLYRIIIDGFESRDQAQKVAVAVKNKAQGVNCVVRAVTTKQ